MSSINQAERDDAEIIDNATGELVALDRSTAPAIAAEINQQIATARAYPRRRDKDIAIEIMGRATLTEEIASECVYSLTRGTKAIVGASIRLAEIARASFGNIRVAGRFVRLDLDDTLRAAVIVEAVALDLQTNNSEVIQVRRSIMSSDGKGKTPRIYNADMINMTVLAALSIARRNAILAVIPKVLWIDAYYGAVDVTRGKADTLADRREKALKFFKSLNVDPEDVCRALGVTDPSEITLDHMPALTGMWTSVKEGESVDSVLDRHAADAGAPAHNPVKSPLRDDPKATNGNAASAGAARDEKPEPEQRRPIGETVTKAADADRQAQEAAKPAPAVVETKPAAETTKPKPAAAADAGAPLPYDDDETYIAHMNKVFAEAKSESAVKNEWGASRAFRNTHLNPSQLQALQANYNACINSLRGS